ncbi:galactitol-1-phosphate 5-dehydrogenase [Candidatus Bipolaricaulota bacterium]|nr:galactitol-1-phosphate 5-dehydrogenase [Candidatus Bipolaricaulota bacterium]
MKRARLTAIEELTFEDVDKPSPEEREVTIEVKVCGICGSDVHTFQGKHPFVHPPIVLGHEFSGVVDEVGDRVDNFRPGDRVTVEPNLPCGACYNCRHGRYNICENLQVIGNVGYDGAFAEFITVPADRVVPIPDGITYDQAALIEPAAVGVHGVRASEGEIGDRVIVFGAGTIGLSILSSVRAAGAKQVVVSDLSDYRLKIAEELGGDVTYNPSRSARDLEDLVLDTFDGSKADIIYDCVGVEETINEAISVARKGSQIVLLGVPEGNLNVNMAFLQDRELEIKGSLMYVRKDFHEAIELIHGGKFKVDKLITHRFSFDELERAFQLAIDETKMGEKMKILVEF